MAARCPALHYPVPAPTGQSSRRHSRLMIEIKVRTNMSVNGAPAGAEPDCRSEAGARPWRAGAHTSHFTRDKTGPSESSQTVFRDQTPETRDWRPGTRDQRPDWNPLKEKMLSQRKNYSKPFSRCINQFSLIGAPMRCSDHVGIATNYGVSNSPAVTIAHAMLARIFALKWPTQR